MIEKIMKAVKSSNKKRSRNITIGAVIGFLLSCTAVMGTTSDNYLWIKGENNGAIEFINQKTTSSDGSGGTWSEENPYEDAGNIWNTEENTYTNNIELSSNEKNGKDQNGDVSYGLRLSGDLNKLNFINNNSIMGTGVRGDRKPNVGILIETTISTLTNNDSIMGVGIDAGVGFGIYNNQPIENLINNGSIIGKSISSANNYGIYAISLIANLANNGLITGKYGITCFDITNLTNNGLITGNYDGINILQSSGNGVKLLINNGLISGTAHRIYNGIKMLTVVNSGIIAAKEASDGYAIFTSRNNSNNNRDNEIIINKGLITATGSSKSCGIYNDDSTNNKASKIIINKGLITATGSSESYGIYNGNGKDKNPVINTGVIYGKANAIKNGGNIDTANNYGILVNGVDGLKVVNAVPGDNPVLNIKEILNRGLIFKALDTGEYKVDEKDYEQFGKIHNDEELIIDYQKDNDGKAILENPIKKIYTIINAEAVGDKDNITGTESILSTELSSDKSYILNGLTGTLKVSGKNNELNDSVINAYETAVVMDGNSALTLNNTIVNGGLSENDSTISVDGSQNVLTIQGNSVINGTMKSTGENNTLNFNGNGENGINVFHNISGFSNMNIDNNVTFFEDIKVTGTKEVRIAETGTLNLRLKNIEEVENVNGENIPKATHAFSGNKMVIQGEGNGKDTAGTLRFLTNGIGRKIYVDLKDIELKNLHITNNSVIDGYKVNDKESIILGMHENLDEIYKPENTRPVGDRYESLNNIYKGLYNSTDDNIDALRTLISFDSSKDNYDESTSDEEQLKNLMSYLGSIYTETPYSFSSELSRKSMGMFRDIITENQFKPNLNQWLIMGGLTHTDGGTKDSYYGQNYHEIDTGTADVNVDMKLTGAYALGKYGYSENISLGVTAGGNKSEAKLPMSKVKGNSGYIGAFAENYRGNLTLKAGAGIQYSEYDADRGTLGGHSYSEKYSDMAYDIYLNGRYSHNIGNNLFLEPYGTLSYTYIKQDGADEGSKVLAIETDSKSFDYTAAKVGLDLKKVIPHEKGKSTLSAGVSYTRLLNGADEENITGRFKGGSDFDILVPHKNEHSIGLNAKYALELESGILFDVKGSYSVERDSHKGTGKNRAKGEWIVGAGLGYKF